MFHTRLSIFVILPALFFMLPACNSKRGADETLLRELDHCIKERTTYYEAREHQTDSLHALLNDSLSHTERFEIYGRLLETYRSYNLDSQQYYTEARLEMAETSFEKQVSLLNYSEVLMRSGMYHETLVYMDSALLIPLDPVLNHYYNHLRRTLFGLMDDFAVTEREHRIYHSITQQYRLELMKIHAAGSFLHELVRADYLYEEQLYDSALYVLEAYESTHHVEGKPFEEPAFAFTRAQIYKKMGCIDQAKHYLIIASLNDLRSSVREYIALRELAVLLCNEGDSERAYKYMFCAEQDAMTGGERVRSFEISTVYPVIQDAYMHYVHRRQVGMIIFFVLVCLIAVLSLVFLLYIHKKHRQLEMLNNRLAQSNEELRKSNHIKSVYVRRFMKMSTIEDFDDAFLELFPDFVMQVQSLLLPEAELRIKPKERLNTDLRVMALIYLGITDSKQIAEILHYSLPTIYNSRTRMRNLAKENRDSFEDKVAIL
ncbi:MAG: hypothetical protein IJV28_05650 [Paludibacteraceae bacterium]|nr:hypothetical protein [Paludibacteraceae bacterium]